MDFNQWKAHAAKKNISKVTYCCGEEPTLIELVIQDMKEILNIAEADYMELSARSDFWSVASTYALNDSANRLIVVRQADTIRNWSQLYDWLAQAKSNPNNYIIFVSYKSDGPATYSKGRKVNYHDYIETIRTKGKFIKCSTPNNEDLVSWSQSFGLGENSAKYVVERTAGDVSKLYNVLRKVSAWNGSPSSKALELLCDQNTSESFVDALIMRNKSVAFLAFSNMTELDKSQALSKLSARLDMLHEIGKYVRKRMYAGDIAANTGINVFTIKKFTDSVKYYDFNKIKYCRQIIANVDAAQRNGVKEGSWEMLIALW